MESLDIVDGADACAADGRPPLALAETCRVIGHDVPLWPMHRERLSFGGCGEGLLSAIEASLAAAIDAYDGERTSRLRAHVEVDTDGRVGVEVVRRLSSLDVVNGPVLVPVCMAELPVPPRLPASAAKPADRGWWDGAARVARRRGGHQALICDADGLVVDGSSATVWALVGDVLVTPPAPPAIAGAARAFVLREAPGLGIATDVRALRVQEVEAAAEVLLTNAFGGAVAARGRGGPVTRAVRDLFAEVWASERPRERDLSA